jgi:hypothetical protein
MERNSPPSFILTACPRHLLDSLFSDLKLEIAVSPDSNFYVERVAHSAAGPILLMPARIYR